MKRFHALLVCLRILLSPRAVVWARRDAPALLLLPGFLLSQVFPLIAAVFSVIAALTGRWYSVMGIMLGLLSGILVGSSQVSSDTAASIGSTFSPMATSYLVRIKELSYPRVGEVEFVGIVVRSMDFNSGKFAPFRARFRAVHLAWRNSAVLERDSVVVIFAKLRLLSANDMPWGFEAHLIRHGIVAEGKAELISEPLIDGVVIENAHSAEADQAHGILWSLAVGRRDVVSRDLEEVFRRLGLSHVLVFSGFQVMLVGGLVSAIAKRILVLFHLSFRVDILALLIGLGCSIWLTELTGWEPSGVRAIVAFVYLAAAHVYQGTNSSPLQKISIGIIGVSLVFPGAIFEPGVQLTFAALLGLVAAPSSGFIVPAVTATVFSSFVGLIWFRQWTPIALLINPLVAPLLTVTGCLLAYPILFLEWLTGYIGIFPKFGIAAAQLLGEFNVWVITLIAQVVPVWMMLKPRGLTLFVTLLVLGSCILAVLINATMRYLMRNGVAFRQQSNSI